jgi:riboflavin kinase/FMN adenylyltransferase
MRVLWDLDSAMEALNHPVLSVGNFDGVHRGHQAILREVIRLSNLMNRPSAVLSFDPHPQKVFLGSKAPPLLTTLPQKIRVLGELGIDAMIICPFNEKIYQYSADQFFSEILVNQLGAVHVVEGEDFTFGKGRTGSPELLKRLGKQHGVGVTIVAPVIFEGERVSSSRIRTWIQDGDVAKARSLLGRPYAVEGKKVTGRGRGKALGYPTVNLVAENELLPAIGIYAVHVELNQKAFLGAASLGFNPTFEGDRFSFEIHLLDFEGEVEDERMTVLFYRRLRDEKRFDTDRELIRQMEADVNDVKRILREEMP